MTSPTRRFRLFFAAIAFYSALSAGDACAQAGPPIVTDDPGTPGANHWEINIASTLEANADATNLELPRLDLNYGAGERVQLKYELPWLLARAGNGAGMHSGFGRPTAGIKWRMFDKEESGTAMSTYPQLTFRSPFPRKNENPDGGTDQEFFAPVEFEQSAEKWDFNQEVGFRWIRNAHGQFVYGFAMTYHSSRELALLGEIHGDAQSFFKDSDLLVNLGCTYDFSERYTLLASAGKTLQEYQNARRKLLAYLGLQLHL
jgi:Putative MetA-pathway of phenol degradation